MKGSSAAPSSWLIVMIVVIVLMLQASAMSYVVCTSRSAARIKPVDSTIVFSDHINNMLNTPACWAADRGAGAAGHVPVHDADDEAYAEAGAAILNDLGASTLDTSCAVKCKSGVFRMSRFDDLQKHPSKPGACYFPRTADDRLMDPSLQRCSRSALGLSADPSVNSVGVETVDGLKRCVVQFEPDADCSTYAQMQAGLRKAAYQRSPEYAESVRQLTELKNAMSAERASCASQIAVLQDSVRACVLPGELAKSTILDSRFKAAIDVLLSSPGKSAPSNVTLLWRASRDGFQARTFHARCDNRGATFTVLKSRSGFIMTAFNAVSWTSQNSYVAAPPGANWLNPLFSPTTGAISTAKAFNTTHPQYSTYCAPNYGPTFGGGHDLYVPDNASSCYCYTYSYAPLPGRGMGYNDAYLGGTSGVQLQDIEVYSVTW